MFDINNPSSRELAFENEIKKTLWRLSKEYVVLINGQTAAGKGTLAKSMIEACDIDVRPLSFVSTGQIYRDGLNDVGPTRFSYSAKRRIREVNDAGKLQPPELSAALVIAETEKVREDDALLIIEGSPRTPEEARILLNYILKVVQKDIFLIDLDTSIELAIERVLGRNATDDRTDTREEDSLRSKLAYYETDVKRAISFMRLDNHVKFARFFVEDGMTPKHVFQEVMKQAMVF